MAELKIQMAAGTNVGLVRQNNEDNFVVCPDLTTSDWRIPQVSEYADLGAFGTLLVVADGMGGANAGEVASAIAVETIQEAFSPDCLQEVIGSDEIVQEFMKEVVRTADLRIFKKSKEDSSTSGMGTTVVMAWILGEKVFVCWCGDSRCYMLNKHKGLVRLSKDHSYVQELIDRGELDPDLAMNHPYSNVITRCLGDMENRAVPDTRVFQLHNGDTILLCSDGLSGLCTDSQIMDLLISFRDNADECKENLISAALNEGGHDNVTVALCNIEIPDEREETDDTLPKGTLPTVSEKAILSETLKPAKPNPRPAPRKQNLWKWLLFTIALTAMALFLAKRFITIPRNQGPDVVTLDSIDNSENDGVVDSVYEENPGTEISTEITMEQEKNKVQSVQVPEAKPVVKDSILSDTIKAGLNESGTEVNELSYTKEKE